MLTGFHKSNKTKGKENLLNFEPIQHLGFHDSLEKELFIIDAASIAPLLTSLTHISSICLPNTCEWCLFNLDEED